MFIPIGTRERQPRHRFPIVTLLLVALSVAVFAYEVALWLEDPVALERFIGGYGMVPREVVSGVDRPPWGPDPVALTVLTSMFLHGGFLHIVGNMLFLLAFGDNVEDRLGALPFLLFYLAAGVAAAAAHIAVDPRSAVPTVGASGAVAGVLGAYLVLHPTGSVHTLVLLGPFVTVTRVWAVLFIGVWVVFQLLSGLASLGVPTAQTDGVAYWAHIGGFAAGVVAALAVRVTGWPPAPRRGPRARVR